MDFFLPRSLEQLWVLLEDNPGARVYAGGTDLLVQMERGGRRPPALICLERIEQLKVIADQGREIFIGAGVTHSQLLENSLVTRHFPVLSKAVAEIGGPQIRNMGTVGGNVVTASPAGDTLPPLYVLGAEVELLRAGGRQRMPLEAFVRGPGRTALEQGQILGGVWIGKQPDFDVHHFEKVGRRKALAIAVVSLAACIALDGRQVVKQIRLAWGSVGPTVVRVPEAEKFLAGRRLEPETLAQAAAMVRRRVSPIDDVRAPANYRRQVAGNLLLRLARYRGGRGDGSP